jgi:SAM-dependent methyltransferase
MTFEQLLAEGAAQPVDGWDFSWLEGRATEERPSWGYTRTAAERLEGAEAVLDVQTGGGEVFAELLGKVSRRPAAMAATEGWPANAAAARERLGAFGVDLRECGETDDLPFHADTFDLVISRHPIALRIDEVARVLRPGGTYLSQGVGVGTNRELAIEMMGSEVPLRDRKLGSHNAEAGALAAGLEVVDLRHEDLRVEFFDVGAIVYFLRKVVWTVPGFTVERYRDKLAELHERIQTGGPIVSFSRRYFIEARKPLS